MDGIHCRICGGLAANAVTNCCRVCDDTIAKAMGYMERELGISRDLTLENAQRWLHTGIISPETYDFYYNVWLVAAFRFSVDEARVREALQTLYDFFETT